MTNYVAIVHKDVDSDFGVSFPDFPGCITTGTNLDEANTNAQEALEAHTNYMRQEGQELPKAMSLEQAVKETLKETPVGFFTTMVISLGLK